MGPSFAICTGQRSSRQSCLRILLCGVCLWVAACSSGEIQPTHRGEGGGPQGGTSGPGGGTNGADPVLRLPIELLGNGAPDEPVVAATTLPLAANDVAAAKSLYVTCHRCGFYDPPEFEALAKPLTTVKASLRIVGSSDDAPWIDITNSSVQVDDVPRAHGGINGALVTLGFHVPIDDATRARLVATPAVNRIEFRFNGTDGNSNGFRILDVQFQDGAAHELSPVPRVWADVSIEKVAGQNASSASAAGQALWTGRNLLIKSPIVPTTIRAACNDCHAADGRDLQYFNYSNNSIVQRSRFHGLTEEQGKNIAAYIRTSLFGRVPHVAAAAPWNPPYQPGAGLDGKPVVEWAAGAGIDAVLPDGKRFVKALVAQPIDDAPLSVSQAELDRAMDPTKVLNTREMPVPLQFPDWNAWLPIVHPLDIWTPDAGQSAGLFEAGYQGNNPLATYASLVKWLETNKRPGAAYGDWSHLTPAQRNDVQGKLQELGAKAIAFGGGGRGTRVSPDPAKPFGVQLGAAKMQAALSDKTAALANLDACGPIGPCTPFNTDSFIERADVGLYHWMGVKQWEIVETHGLQDQRSFHGTVDATGTWVGQGEVRGWPYGWASIFYLAPHMIYAPTRTAQGLREFYFSWEKRLVSYYLTDAWYALQVTINAGWAGASNGAVDWPYTQGFVTGLVDDLRTAKAPAWISAAHLARYFQINAKLGQLANTDIPFNQPDPVAPTDIWRNKGLQSRADLLFKLSPATIMDFMPDQPTRFRLLDELAPGLHVMFVNAALSAYAVMFFDTSPSQYRICDATNVQMGSPEPYAGQRFCADAARTPLPLDSKGRPYCIYPANVGLTTEQFSVWGVMMATQLGANPALVQHWSAWNDRMWPK